MERKNNMLKQALKRRETGALPSNFTYRMMKDIRLEAERRRKRQVLITWASLIAATVFIMGMAVYFVIFYMDFNITDYISGLEIRKPSFELFGFYWYVGFLALVLLAFDYWMRHKQRKSTDE